MTLHSNKVTIVAVVPAFNEEKTIAQVVTLLSATVDAVVVVDDCSSDATVQQAQIAGAIVVSHERNTGYDGAINTGFNRAIQEGADIVCTFDADGQHDTADIPRLTGPLIAGDADIVIGSRAKSSSFGERLFSLYTTYRFGIKDPLCGFKAYRSAVFNDIGYFDTMQSIGTQLFLESIIRGYRVICVPITIHKREDVSRFYAQRIKGNARIIKSLLRIVVRIETLRKNRYETR